MNLFDSVVIGCDNSLDMIKDARAIRAVLETFGLRVHLYDLTRKREALQFLAGGFSPCQYVILCCHGGDDPDAGAQINLQVVDQAGGDYDNAANWERVTVSLTPANIPDIVRGMGRTLICYACGSGREPFARAFLEAGYKAYIAPIGSGVYGNAAVLFVLGLFYHLLTASRLDDEPTCHTDHEAVSLAAEFDANTPRGTRPFRYYS